MTTENHFLDILPQALIGVGGDSCVTFMNPAAEMLLGVSAGVSAGRRLESLPGMAGEVAALCERAGQTGEALTLHDYVLKLPLAHHEVELAVLPILPPQAGASVLLTIARGETMLRSSSSLWKHEITRASGVMAAMLAHEVKNPLAGIVGAAQLLEEETAAEHQALARLIRLEAGRIADLLAQVEIFAGHDTLPPQAINIHEVLQYVIEVAGGGFARHVAFTTHYDPSLPPVSGQRELLVQLFLNLVKNAAEALAGQADAEIILSTGYRGKARGGLPVEVTVADNGPGIPPEIRGQLFEPFVSSKQEGRGLGLAIVAKIASDLGATVELDTEAETGACFRAYLAQV